jgi:hypothetical protein
MSTELKYKVTISADARGALDTAAAMGRLRTQTEDVMNAMASRAGSAQAGFAGIERAAKGDAAAMFGLARAVKALFEAFANGNPAVRVVTLIAMAIGVASAAWQRYKAHQDNAAQAMEKASEAAKTFQAALKAVNDARSALNLNPQIASLDQLTKAFERASKAMDDMHKAENSLRGVRLGAELAGVDEREAVALRLAGGDDAEKSRIKFNAERERLGVKSGGEYADIEAQQSQMQERAKFLRTQANDLNAQISREDIFGAAGLPGPLAASEKKLAQLRAELKTMGVSDKGGVLSSAAGAAPSEAAVEKVKEYDAALRENEQLRAADEKRNAQIKEQIKSALDELALLEKHGAVLEEQKTTLAAQTAAADAKISAEQEAAQIALDQEVAQKRLLELKKQEKDLRDGILRAARDTAAIAEEESGETVANLQEDADNLKKKAEHQKKMVMDPAYRAGHVGMDDAATKDQEREQESWDKKVKRAMEQKARGAYGKGIDRVLLADATGKAARIAQAEAEKAQKEMAENMKLAKDYLIIISDDLPSSYQFS